METVKHDSRPDTLDHINRVQNHLFMVVDNLKARALRHDASKLESPEREAFDSLGDNLKGLTYGSPEYKEQLRKIKPAIEHHYSLHSHHPEHFERVFCLSCGTEYTRVTAVAECTACGSRNFGVKGGFSSMTLLDLIEMLADWKAAGERHADGSLPDSLVKNRERFKISPELFQILKATATELGWL